MKGDTLNFIGAHFRCTSRECEFIDNLCDNDFPSFADWDDDVFEWYISGESLCNYLIRALFDEVISHYTELGLDENKFDAEVNSVCSCLSYDGKKVTEEDLDRLVEELENENEQSEYIDEQGNDTRLGEDKEINDKFWK